MGIFTPQNPGIGGLKELTQAEEIFLTRLAGLGYNESDILKIVSGLPEWVSDSGSISSFEAVSKNLNSYDYAINYSGGDVSDIVYDLGGGLQITKTFNYTSGNVTSVVLSGDTPSGISLTKTINYSGGDVSSISYS